MAKFYGQVGYGIPQRGTGDEDDIIRDRITERDYFGDVLRNAKRNDAGSSINDDVKLNNQISIMADAYAWDHYFAIKYVRWMGACWKVTNVEVQRPRLILTIGDVWNGETARSDGTAAGTVSRPCSGS